MKLLSAVLFFHLSIAMAGAFPDSKRVAGRELQLNGVGMREATIFKVDVYRAGLYLTKKITDGVAALEQEYPKRLEMVFVRNVEKDDLIKAWNEGFQKNCAEQCSVLKDSIAQLNELMESMTEGDPMAFNFISADELQVFVKRRGPVTLKAAGFSPVLLSFWLGESPPNSGLKSGLLGQ